MNYPDVWIELRLIARENRADLRDVKDRLDKIERDNEWDHGQVQAELNRRLIMRRKVLPADLGRTPMDLMELRHLADYKPQPVSATEAKRACDRAKKFLWSIKNALKENYEP